MITEKQVREWCNKNHSDGAYQIELLEKFLREKGLLHERKKVLGKVGESCVCRNDGARMSIAVEEIFERRDAADRLRDALRRIECDESTCRRIREALNAAYDDGLFEEDQ